LITLRSHKALELPHSRTGPDLLLEVAGLVSGAEKLTQAT
jgi:hypothetical protein